MDRTRVNPTEELRGQKNILFYFYHNINIKSTCST